VSIQTLYTAASGMDAMQTKLDVIANNIANMNTTAFKRDRANFEDLLYRTEVHPGILDAQQNPTPVGVEIGLGTRVQSTQKDFRQGTIEQTGRELDLRHRGAWVLPSIRSSIAISAIHQIWQSRYQRKRPVGHRLRANRSIARSADSDSTGSNRRCHQFQWTSLRSNSRQHAIATCWRSSNGHLHQS
jgi:hypothetical protein